MALSKHWLARAAKRFSGDTWTGVQPGRKPQNRKMACFKWFSSLDQPGPLFLLLASGLLGELPEEAGC
jgi:hypothetical protein